MLVSNPMSDTGRTQPNCAGSRVAPNQLPVVDSRAICQRARMGRGRQPRTQETTDGTAPLTLSVVQLLVAGPTIAAILPRFATRAYRYRRPSDIAMSVGLPPVNSVTPSESRRAAELSRTIANPEMSGAGMAAQDPRGDALLISSPFRQSHPSCPRSASGRTRPRNARGPCSGGST
jgi:hypothetical protein